MERCEHCNEVGETRDQIKKMYHIITGNGDPKTGLVFKVAMVEEHVNFVHKFGWMILSGAVGVPFFVLGGFILFLFTRQQA